MNKGAALPVGLQHLHESELMWEKMKILGLTFPVNSHTQGLIFKRVPVFASEVTAAVCRQCLLASRRELGLKGEFVPHIRSPEKWSLWRLI